MQDLISATYNYSKISESIIYFIFIIVYQILYQIMIKQNKIKKNKLKGQSMQSSIDHTANENDLRMRLSERRLDDLEKVIDQCQEAEEAGQSSQKAYSNLRSPNAIFQAKNQPQKQIIMRTISATSLASSQSFENLPKSSVSEEAKDPSFAQKCQQQNDKHERYLNKQNQPKMTIKGVSNTMKNKKGCKANLSLSQSIVSDIGSPLHKFEHPNTTSNVIHKRQLQGHESGFQLTKQIKRLVEIESAKSSKRHFNQTFDQKINIRSCKNIHGHYIEENKQSPTSASELNMTNEMVHMPVSTQMKALSPIALPANKDKRKFLKSQTSQLEPGSPQQKSMKSVASYMDSFQSIDKQDLISKYHEKCRVIDAGHEKIQFLETQLHRSKLFLNMVVHDMRNPTKSIKMGLSSSISKLRGLIKIKQDHEDFEQSCEKLQSHINSKQKFSKNIQSQHSCQRNLFCADDSNMTVRISVLNDQVKQTFKKLNQNHDEFEQMNFELSEAIKLVLEDISKDYEESEIMNESFEDFNLDQIDEYGQAPDEGGDQIVQFNPQGSFQQNIRKLTQFSDQGKTNESNLLGDKKQKLEKALHQLLKEFPSSNQSNNKLIQDFSTQYYQEEPGSFVNILSRQEEKPEVYDFSQQVDFDFETRHKASKLDQIKTSIQDIQISQQKMQDHVASLKEQIGVQQSIICKQLLNLAFQNDEHKKLEQISNKQLALQSKFYAQQFQTIYEKTRETENILQQQMFSQQMMENLINDLLDLAKMQNNTFQFNNSYFSLSNVIYEAFQMLIHSANENGIELKSEIDFKTNLQLIEAIDGDENRILQILLNFLSNSLKFTDPGGSVTVKVEILDQQLIMKKTPKQKDSSISLQKSISLGAFSQISQKKKRSNKNIMDMMSGANHIQQQSEHDDMIIKTIEQEFYKNFPSQKTQEEEKQRGQCHQYTKGQEKFIHIKISVIDTGIGISDEGLKKLFIDFGKLDENSTRNRKGTGLGLSICKQIIEQMGGSVDVRSKLGQGTEFIINIKTKCKVEDVQFSEFADKEKFEDDFARSSPQPYKRIRRKAAEHIFFKFIEKPKDELKLKTCMEEQITKHKSSSNENEIQQLTEFERKFNTTKSSCKNDIERLIEVIQSMQSIDKLMQSEDQQIRKNNWKFTYLPQSFNNSNLSKESHEEQKEFNLDQIQEHNNDLLESPLHNLSIQSKQSARPAQATSQNNSNSRDPSAFSFQDVLRDPSSSSDRQQQNSSINSNNNQQQQNLSSSQNQSHEAEARSQRVERVDFQQSSLLEESKSDSRNLESRGLPISESNGLIQEVEESKERSPEQQHEKSESQRPFRVLIANDEQMQLYMLQVIFQMNNFEVVIAQNGHEAFEHVVQSFRLGNDDVQQLFDLILLDLNMPISDGFETCKNIVNLYNDNNKIFKNIKKSSSFFNKSSLEQLDEQPNEEIDAGQNLQNQDLKPIILAVTSEVLHEELRENLQEIGFQAAYEAPLRDAIIKNIIIPQLEERQQMLSDKNQLLNIMKEGVEVISSPEISASGPQLQRKRSLMSFKGEISNNNHKNTKKIKTVTVRKKSSLKVVSRITVQAQKKLSMAPPKNKDNSKQIMKTPKFQTEGMTLQSENSFRNVVVDGRPIYSFNSAQIEESKVPEQIKQESKPQENILNIRNQIYNDDQIQGGDRSEPSYDLNQIGAQQNKQFQNQPQALYIDSQVHSQASKLDVNMRGYLKKLNTQEEPMSSKIPILGQDLESSIQKINEKHQSQQNLMSKEISTIQKINKQQDSEPANQVQGPLPSNHYVFQQENQSSSSSHSLRSHSNSPVRNGGQI